MICRLQRGFIRLHLNIESRRSIHELGITFDVTVPCTFEVPDLPIEDLRRLVDSTDQEAEDSLSRATSDVPPRFVTPQDSEFEAYAALMVQIGQMAAKDEGSSVDQQQFRDLVDDCIQKAR